MEIPNHYFNFIYPKNTYISKNNNLDNNFCNSITNFIKKGMSEMLIFINFLKK